MLFRNKCKLYIIGNERGGLCDTPHLQGYCENKTKCRPMGLLDTKRIHWEKSKGTREENEVYCSKENTSMLYMHVHVACSMCMCMCMLHVMWAVNGHPNLGQRTRSHHDSGHPNTAILT